MSYSYDRTKTARVDTWGTAVVNWMGKFLTDLLKAAGQRQSISRLGQYGWMAELSGTTRADIEYTGAISVDWLQKGVFINAWIDNPQRGRQDLVKEVLDFGDDPGAVIQKVVRQLKSL